MSVKTPRIRLFLLLVMLLPLPAPGHASDREREQRLADEIVDAILDGNAVKGVITESKSGRQAILARCVIDATGDADLAFRAGAP